MGSRLVVALALALVAATASAASTASASSVRARPPSVLLDTSYAPPTGGVINVHAGDDLQAALDRAAPGDQVVLEAGAALATGRGTSRSITTPRFRPAT